MKTLRSIKYLLSASGLMGILLFSACSPDEGPSIELDEATVELEVVADSDFEEVDDLVVEAMGAAESANSQARTLGVDDPRFRCAQVTLDRETRTITIDFGDGCQGPDGRIRAGKISINYSGFRFLPGAMITTRLENFLIDRRRIDGVRTVENVSDGLDSDPRFRVTLENGRIVFEDGLEATRSVDRTRIWQREPNPVNDRWLILEGSTASGINRAGNSYEVTVLETLVYRRNCRDIRVFVPVSGVKQIIIGDHLITIDFGDGACDNIIVVNFNGRIETIDLRPHNPNG